MSRTLTGALAFGVLVGSLMPHTARADESMSDADAAALSLADTEPDKPAAPVARPWKFFVQDAVRESGYRDQPSSLRNQASLDLIWQYRLGRRRKRGSGLDWDRHSCFRPRPPSLLVKARGRRARRLLRFIQAFREC